MAADAVTPAILEYVSHNTYPSSESISSAELNSTSLASLTQELHKAQDSVKVEIRSISRDASSDIDTWISRAKELQADILRSRETARKIVEDAERGKELREKADDRKGKVELLEREVEFQERLQARLERVGFAKGVIAEVQDRAAKGDVVGGLRKLEEAEESTRVLGGAGKSGVASVLEKRTEILRESLRENVTGAWHERVSVQVEGRSVKIENELEDLVTAAKGLSIFDTLLAEFGRDFERAIVRPRMTMDRTGEASTIQASAGQLFCTGSSQGSSLKGLMRDLSTVLDFLATHLPASVSVPLSNSLLPAVVSRLEEEWLQPAIPLEISEMPSFQEVLNVVSGFADKIDQLGFSGSQPLRDWVNGAARYWLTRRREALLDAVRNLVFAGLRETKTVERVETQMVSNDDELGQGDTRGDDDWDTAWDEPEEEVASASQAQQLPASTKDDDDGSAWDVPDDNEPTKEDENDGDEAWGWGDGDDDATALPSNSQRAQPTSPGVNGQQAAGKSSEREMTLRETFTVTVVPEGILELLQQVINDGQTLAGPEYAATPIAPAAAALYTLPTLALAIYRATAPTAYNKLATGNMLIYNDANRLSEQLRAWQASQSAASRLRLDSDVKSLDEFAKRAYSAEMEAQRTILTDLLDGAQGFSNCTAQPYKAECESAVEQTTDRLRDVYKQWTPMLSNSALLQSIGSLLSTVTSKMIREVEDLPDIGEAESKEVKSLCDRISSAKDLFAQTTPDGETRDMTFIYCPNWLKFQYLAELMESSLADIKYLWKEGELSLEFDGEEVVGLVEALFAESGLRRQAIQDIRRGGRR